MMYLHTLASGASLSNGRPMLIKPPVILARIFMRNKRRAAPSCFFPLGGRNRYSRLLGAFSNKRRAAPTFCNPLAGRTMRVIVLGAVLDFLGTASANAGPLVVERMVLGPANASQQHYNAQEQGDLRVFARSAADFEKAQIYWQRRVNGHWGQPEILSFSEARWRDSDPHLSSDGKTLTFISDRPTQGDQPIGQLDIFETIFSDTGWSSPRRLSESVQSTRFELGPERYGNRLYFGSYRQASANALTIYVADRLASGEHTEPSPLPTPINVGKANGDFTLSPDGRYALWWSNRDKIATNGSGDIFIAERVGAEFGAAIRLPEPINGPGFEFTPSVSSDGQWLLFASTRPGMHDAGLSQVYRVSWPDLLQELGPQIEAKSQAQLMQRVTKLWASIGHPALASSDIAGLRSLLHERGQVWGQGRQSSSLIVNAWSGEEFLKLLSEPDAAPLLECELHREVRRHGGHAQVYSVVESRARLDQTQPGAIGVNSSQWQLGPVGWQLLSLHYAMALPGQALPLAVKLGGVCLSS